MFFTTVWIAYCSEESDTMPNKPHHESLHPNLFQQSLQYAPFYSIINVLKGCAHHYVLPWEEGVEDASSSSHCLGLYSMAGHWLGHRCRLAKEKSFVSYPRPTPSISHTASVQQQSQQVLNRGIFMIKEISLL